MKRITIFLAAAAALLAFSSCNKDAYSVPSAEKAVLTVNIVSPDSYPTTKATGEVNTTTPQYQTADESAVNNLQVFVFSNGTRDGYASVTTSTAQVSCTAGSREVYAVVNAPNLSSITTKTALLAAVSTLDAQGGFEMIGSATATVPSTQAVPITVNRIAAKIVVLGIENALSIGKAMTVKRVFISNVAAQINYGLDAYATASQTWYNKGGYSANNNLGAYTNDVDLTAAVASGNTYSTDHYFYAYPNNYAQANYDADGWFPKRTMLVIQIEVDGSLYDYPIDLGVDLEPNKMYVVSNVKLVNLGNEDDGEEGGSDEEDPITSSSVQVTITVNDWTIVNLNEIEI